MEQKEIEKLLEGVAEKNGKAIKDAVKAEIEAAAKGFVTPELLVAKLEEAGLKKDTIEKIEQALEKQGEEMRKNFAEGKKNGKDWEQIVDEHADAIKGLAKSGQRSTVKLELPSVRKTAVARSSVTSSYQAMRLPDVAQAPYLGTTLAGLFRHVNVGPDSNGVIRYIDQATVTRNAAMTAEAGTKPESAITWQEYALTLEKVADSIPVSKEAYADVNFIKGELQRLLEVNLALALDDELYDGSGSTPHLKGVYTSATSWTYSSYTGYTAYQANIFDLIMVMASQLSSGKQSKYSANTVLISPTDALRMDLVKDANGVPLSALYRQAMSAMGINIVVSNQVTANTMLVGDFRYGTIYDLEGVTIEMGWIDQQFVKNQFTILAEQRLALLIRTIDADAFLKVTNITAALNYIGNS